MTLEEAMHKDFENFMKDQLTKAYIKGYERAQSERKSGEWIEHDPNCVELAKVYECPRCGEEVNGEPTNFCPNCGADMRGDTK